jgi:putative thioredoxin
VELVKLNTDENPQVATQLRISSIPHVMAFKDGKLAKQFVGAVPEPQARSFFEGLVPSQAEIEAQRGEEAVAAGDVDAAIVHFEAALAAEPELERAVSGLASVLLHRGDIARAVEVIAPVAAYSRNPELKRIAARVRRARAGAGG